MAQKYLDPFLRVDKDTPKETSVTRVFWGTEFEFLGIFYRFKGYKFVWGQCKFRAEVILICPLFEIARNALPCIWWPKRSYSCIASMKYLYLL